MNDGGESPPGHAPPAADVQQLARDWITLWQSELAALAADRESQEAWRAMLAVWAAAASTILRTAPPQPPHDGAGGRAGAAASPGASPAAAAPDPRDAEVERLARRVGELEARLAELERGGGNSPNPRRRRR